MNKHFSLNTLIVLFSLIGVASAISPASANTSFALISVPSLPKLVTEVDATAKTEIKKGVTSSAQETTSTTVGTVAGASSDSQTTASVADPTQLNLSSLSKYLNQPTEIIQKTGQATVAVESDKEGIHIGAKADLGVKVDPLANVGICLDSNVSLSSPNPSSAANCSESITQVPEPGAIGGLALIGAYLIYRRKGKVSRLVVLKH